MTERLYYNDSYLREFEARVIDTADDGRRVYLDRTAFYPASGGQPFDLGSLSGAAVIEVIDEGERVAHVVERPVPAGEVRGEIDWPGATTTCSSTRTAPALGRLHRVVRHGHGEFPPGAGERRPSIWRWRRSPRTSCAPSNCGSTSWYARTGRSRSPTTNRRKTWACARRRTARACCAWSPSTGWTAAPAAARTCTQPARSARCCCANWKRSGIRCGWNSLRPAGGTARPRGL